MGRRWTVEPVLSALRTTTGSGRLSRRTRIRRGDRRLCTLAVDAFARRPSSPSPTPPAAFSPPSTPPPSWTRPSTAGSNGRTSRPSRRCWAGSVSARCGSPASRSVGSRSGRGCSGSANSGRGIQPSLRRGRRSFPLPSPRPDDPPNDIRRGQPPRISLFSHCNRVDLRDRDTTPVPCTVALHSWDVRLAHCTSVAGFQQWGNVGTIGAMRGNNYLRRHRQRVPRP